MTWVKNFVLKLSADPAIHVSAKLYRDYFGLQQENCWVNGGDTKFYDKKWNLLSDGCFQSAGIAPPDLQSRIMILAHGSPGGIGDSENGGRYSPNKLANYFARWGIRKAGLISFKCCHVGEQNFLDYFRDHLEKKGIEVGWLKGYKGATSTYLRQDESYDKTYLKKQLEMYHDKKNDIRLNGIFINNGTIDIGNSPGRPYEAALEDDRNTIKGSDRLKIIRGTCKLPNKRFEDFLEAGDAGSG